MAFVQKKIMYILTEIFYTQIGHFHSRHFVDNRVQAPLKKFQQALKVNYVFIQTFFWNFEFGMKKVAIWIETQFRFSIIIFQFI